jgi:hypothetical protein
MWNSSPTIVRTVGVSLRRFLQRIAYMTVYVQYYAGRVHLRYASGCFAPQRNSAVKRPIVAAYQKYSALLPPIQQPLEKQRNKLAFIFSLMRHLPYFRNSHRWFRHRNELQSQNCRMVPTGASPDMISSDFTGKRRIGAMFKTRDTGYFGFVFLFSLIVISSVGWKQPTSCHGPLQSTFSFTASAGTFFATTP